MSRANAILADRFVQRSAIIRSRLTESLNVPKIVHENILRNVSENVLRNVHGNVLRNVLENVSENVHENVHAKFSEPSAELNLNAFRPRIEDGNETQHIDIKARQSIF